MFCNRILYIYIDRSVRFNSAYIIACIVCNSDFQIVFSNQISLKTNFIMNANLKENSQHELQLPKYHSQ
jgi:hypothetical protein